MDRGDKSFPPNSSRPRRHAVDLQGWAYRGTAEFPCHVSDLSLEGCCITGYFAVGEFIRIRIEKLGSFDAQVRWAVMEKAGVRFVTRERNESAASLASDDKGVTAVEYGFVAALIAVSLLGALTETGSGVARAFGFIHAAMPDHSSCVAVKGAESECRT